MKKRLLIVVASALALGAVGLQLAPLRAQTSPAPPSWPVSATLTANTTLASCPQPTANTTGCVAVGLDPRFSNCTVTAQSGATFGSGTLTIYTSGDQAAADAHTVSGYADIGNPASPASTLTAAGALTFAVAAKTTLYVVLTGATSPSIGVQVFCAQGVARIGGGSGGGSTPSPIPSGQIMGNIGAVAGTPVPNPISSVLDNTLGATQGNIAYRSATGWQGLGPGTAGQVLTSGGSGANPAWSSTPSPPPGWNTIAFSSSATGTNWNPQSEAQASSYFASTTTITPPSAPYTLRIHAMISLTSLTAHDYYGILVGSDGSHFEDIDVNPLSGGYGEICTDCTTTTNRWGGYVNPNPSPSPVAGQVVQMDITISVTSSTLALIGATINGGPAACKSGSCTAGTTVFQSTNVNLTTAFSLYCVGSASTDCGSVVYSTNPLVSDSGGGGGGAYAFAAVSPLGVSQSGNTITYSCTTCPNQSFEQTVKNFCTTNAISGCHYWPMNETTGSTMFDAIGSLNGTYADPLTTGANYDPGEPMGMPDGSVGVDMWEFSGGGYGYVTGLPTTSPAEYVAGVVVRDCEQQSLATNKVYLFDTYTSGTYANSGMGTFLYQSALQGDIGNGTSVSQFGYIQNNYTPTCEPKLLMMNTNYISSTVNWYWQVNNVPNLDGATGGAVSSGLQVNAGPSGVNGGHGNVYCCMFYIPGNFGTTQLTSLQAAFGR